MRGPLVDQAYRRSRTLRTATTTALLTLWDRNDDYGDEGYERFAAAAGPRLEAAQVAVWGLLAAAWVAQASRTLGRPVPPVPVPPSRAGSTQALRGITVQQLLERPFVEVRRALASGMAPPLAAVAGRTRLKSLSDTGMQLASTHASDAAMTHAYAGTQYAYYRRVTTGAEDCALCELAATMVYTRGDLLPIHPGCDCEVDGPYSSREEIATDPAEVDGIHALVAEQIGKDAADRSGQGYRDLIVTRQHGEIGPVLTVRGQHHTGPSDVP